MHKASRRIFAFMALIGMGIAMSLTGFAAELGPEPLVLYAAPKASGTGDGSSTENVAYFRDARFWQTVNATLQTQSVTVNLLPGQYIFSKLVKDGEARGTLRFTNFGHPEHQFVLQGLYREGTIFTSDPDEAIDQGMSIELLRFQGQNAVFRNIHFTGQQHMGYTTHFTGKNILIENNSFTELVNTYYGASGTGSGSEYIIWRNNYFKRVGLDSHAHMIYNAYGPQHVYVIGNHFEDTAGDYIRFRDQTDYVVVYGNTFVSTGTYTNGNMPFVSIPLFNDDDPENPGPNPRFEYFGTHMLVANNTFIYPDDNSPGNRRVFLFLQSGYDPPGRNLLLSPQEARFLQTAPIEERKAFMLENFGIDTDRVYFADNILTGRNVTNSLFYRSYSNYGARDRGFRDYIDITPTIRTETVVRSVEEAMAFWPAYIESLKYFAAPRDGDVITQPVTVQIKTPQFDLKSLQIALDGEVVYSGETLPTDLTLRPAEMTADKHVLYVTQLDADGNQYEEEIAFTVQHIAVDTSGWGRTATGRMSIPLISDLNADEYQSVVIKLTRILAGDRAETYSLYSGSTQPAVYELDTLAFEDGAYDFDVHYTTKYGVTGSISQRMVIDNWTILEDAILPPSTHPWFGASDRLHTVERSSGWEFTDATPELFFGDADRITPGSSHEEYLTWRWADLYGYQFTLYVHDSDIEQVLTLAASADGEEWQPVAYTATVQEQNAAGWRKVLVEGTTPEDQSMEWIRFALRGGTEIELGHAHLAGRRF